MASVQPLNARQEQRLLKAARGGDEASLRALVENYLPRVVHWVSPRRGGALSFQELIALGNCALMQTLGSWNGDPKGLADAAFLGVRGAIDEALKAGA
jgi:DNA-directed RNA polymerase sigma subunit (sigma70/sigma32)